ncbi:hypothetical protein BCER1_46680 [Bacillus cereus]|nr:hypothetical protein BCER1_46680 [Bacillus cereus]
MLIEALFYRAICGGEFLSQSWDARKCLMWGGDEQNVRLLYLLYNFRLNSCCASIKRVIF